MEETGKGRKVEHVHGCSWPPFMAPLKQGCRESPVEGSLCPLTVWFAVGGRSLSHLRAFG